MTDTPKKNRICFCHGVDEDEIRQAIRKGAHTIEAIQSETLASTGCGGCSLDVEQILKEELEKIKKTG
ncbi:MAG: (2Fe-2S)-binding protein [Bacteriovoracia bacterium]